jgi:site-specific recombinase XerD
MATLYLRGKTWWVHYSVKGRQIRESTKIPKDQKKLAEGFLHEIEGRLARGCIGWDISSPDLKGSMNRYLDSVRQDRKPKTFTRYYQYLRYFSEYLKVHHRTVHSLAEITPAIVEKFKTHRLELKKSKQTVKGELEGLRTFWNWCINLDLAKTNPVLKVKKPVPYRKLPRIYTSDELERIFAAAKDRAAFYEFLYRSGFRLEEACAVRVKDIDLGNNLIRYRNAKGGRDEWCEINSSLVPLLKAQIAGKQPEDLIFRYEFDHKHNRIRMQFQALLRDLKIPHGTLHNFKNSFVTHLLDAGVDPRIVQGLAHHEDLETTLRYARKPSSERVKGAVNRLPV